METCAVGASDELGLQVASDRVHIHDLQAIIRHCMRMEHTRHTYRHMAHDFRLTDVEGKVVHKMLA